MLITMKTSKNKIFSMFTIQTRLSPIIFYNKILVNKVCTTVLVADLTMFYNEDWRISLKVMHINKN